MIGIIQRRESILSTPFTSDHKGMQMCCTIAIIAVIMPAVSTMPLLNAKAISSSVSVQPERKNWLECNSSSDMLLSCSLRRQAAIDGYASGQALLRATIKKQSLLFCSVSTGSALYGSAAKLALLNLEVSVGQELSALTVKTELLSAKISRPICEG